MSFSRKLLTPACSPVFDSDAATVNSAALAFFSLAGIPPLVGFYAKVFVFFSAIKSSLYLVAFVVLAISVISTFYYISVVKTIYFEKNKNWIFYDTISKEKSIVLAISLGEGLS